jgi:hypothetical protein
MPMRQSEHIVQPESLQRPANSHANQQAVPQRNPSASGVRAGSAPNISRDAALLRHTAAARSSRVGATTRQLQRHYGNSYTTQVATAAQQIGGDAAPQTAPQITPAALKMNLRPHSGTDTELRALAPIYQQGKTPIAQSGGQPQAADLTPADVTTTGQQIEQIQQQFGRQGLEQTIRGLTLTRGAAFTAEAITHAPAARTYASEFTLRAANLYKDENDALSVGAKSQQPTRATGDRHTEGMGGEVARMLETRGTGQALPEAMRKQLAPMVNDTLDDVKIYTDSAANAAADRMGARAFALGRGIYFAAGEFNPSSERGYHLLAHEIAHTIQQRGATLPALHTVQIGAATDSAEHEAERFADQAARGETSTAPFQMASNIQVARVQRVISFARTSDAVGVNTMGVTESAAGFQIAPNASPLFQWHADVTINGAAGDPFADFEAGPHQVVRSFQANFHWGSGANHTHRRLTCSAFPVRDAVAAGNTWYHDPYAVAFSANGETQNTGLDDSPQSSVQPWANPVAGRGGTTGYFNYGAAFVAYISARDTTRGTGARAFRALGCLYWNIPLTGTFDTSQPVGSRVSIGSGGTVNQGKIIEGGSGEFPSMHGGSTGNGTFVVTTT